MGELLGVFLRCLHDLPRSEVVVFAEADPSSRLLRRKPIKVAIATLIRLPVAAVGEPPEGLDDGDPLTGGEILAERVLVGLTLGDGDDRHDPGRDHVPFKDVSVGEQAAIAPDQVHFGRDPDRLKEPALDAGGEGSEITQSLAMAFPDLDLGDREQANVVHHVVRHGNSSRSQLRTANAQPGTRYWCRPTFVFSDRSVTISVLG